MTFVTFQSFGIINNSSQNTCSLLSNVTIFGEWSDYFFWNVFLNLNVCVIHYKKQIGKYLYLLEFLELPSIFTKNGLEIRQKVSFKSEKCFKSTTCSKTRHVLKVWVRFKTVNCSRTRHASKVSICFQTVKCTKVK